MVATNFSTLTDGFQFLSLFDQAFAQCMPGATFDKTASYTLTANDNGQTIALDGGALNTLTVGVATGFPSAYAARIINKDTGRGKVMAINGIASFILWPLQSLLLFNDNGAWQIAPRVQPWVVPAGTTFNVDNVSGSDAATNDGLGTGAGAFLTIQHAWNVINKNILQIGAGVLIQLPATTSAPITEAPTFTGAMPGGVDTLTIVGNAVTPTNCQWQPSGPVVVTDYQSITFSGIGWSIPGGSGTFLQSSQYSIVDCNNCDFGVNAAGSNFTAGTFGRINIVGGCSISGSCGQFAQPSDGGTISLNTSLKIVGTVTTTIFVNALYGGGVDVSGLAFTGGTLNGQQFISRWGGWIRGDSGVSWPGSMSAGVASLGGTSDAGITSAGAKSFANLPQAPVQGTIAVITDSTTNTWGATVSTGGGTITVISWFNNSNWTVMGK